jgi:hypothetical protein
VNDRTWFRLLLRAVGVLLLGLSMPVVIDRIVSLVGSMASRQEMTGSDFTWRWMLWLAGPLVQLALAGYLIIGPSRLERICMWGLDADAPDMPPPPTCAP